MGELIDFASARAARQPSAVTTAPVDRHWVLDLEQGDPVSLGGNRAVFLAVQRRPDGAGGTSWHCWVLTNGVMVICPPQNLKPVPFTRAES
jgi:hypothetical protein